MAEHKYNNDRVRERILSRTDRGGDCWVWLGRKNPLGYGEIDLYRDPPRRAHRVSYEAFVGPIPADLVLDHLCRNTSCVNPAHLEPVTSRVNFLRGEALGARAQRYGVCIRGHLRTVDNLTKAGQCKTCMADRTRARRARLAARSA